MSAVASLLVTKAATRINNTATVCSKVDSPVELWCRNSSVPDRRAAQDRSRAGECRIRAAPRRHGQGERQSCHPRRAKVANDGPCAWVTVAFER